MLKNSAQPAHPNEQRELSSEHARGTMLQTMPCVLSPGDDDDVQYYFGKNLKLKGQTENRGICAKKRISMKAVVLMGTLSTKKSLGGRCGGQRQQKGGEGRGHFSTKRARSTYANIPVCMARNFI